MGDATSTWQWCGHVRTRRPTQYRLAVIAGMATRTAHAAVTVRPNGDLLCRCSAHSRTARTELVIAAQVGSNMSDATTAVVSILDPCAVAVCQHADALQLRRAPRVHVLPPNCGVRADSKMVAQGKFEVVVTTEAMFSSRSCNRLDEQGQLVITHHPHPAHPHLIVLQTFPLDLISCASGSSTATPISLQQLQEHSASPAEMSQRVRRQGNLPLHFDQLHYIVRVRENSPTGTEVTTVRVSGQDSSSLGEITYSMAPEDAHSSQLFSLHPTTGVITTTGGCTRWCLGVYGFSLQSSDGIHGPSLNCMNVAVLDTTYSAAWHREFHKLMYSRVFAKH